MVMFNGAQLIGALPMHAGNPTIKHWIVLLERQDERVRDRWVTVHADTLDGGSWDLGHYFDSLARAEADLYIRAGVLAVADILVDIRNGAMPTGYLTRRL